MGIQTLSFRSVIHQSLLALLSLCFLLSRMASEVGFDLEHVEIAAMVPITMVGGSIARWIEWMVRRFV